MLARVHAPLFDVDPPIRAKSPSEGVRAGRDGGGGGSDRWGCRDSQRARFGGPEDGSISVISFGLLLMFKQIPEPVLIVGAGLAGIVLHDGL